MVHAMWKLSRDCSQTEITDSLYFRLYTGQDIVELPTNFFFRWYWFILSNNVPQNFMMWTFPFVLWITWLWETKRKILMILNNDTNDIILARISTLRRSFLVFMPDIIQGKNANFWSNFTNFLMCFDESLKGNGNIFVYVLNGKKIKNE